MEVLGTRTLTGLCEPTVAGSEGVLASLSCEDIVEGMRLDRETDRGMSREQRLAGKRADACRPRTGQRRGMLRGCGDDRGCEQDERIRRAELWGPPESVSVAASDHSSLCDSKKCSHSTRADSIFLSPM